jgi:hypothetical protein
MKKFALTVVALMIAALTAGLISAAPANAATPAQALSLVAASTSAKPAPVTRRPQQKALTAMQRKFVQDARARELSKPSSWRGITLVHPTGRTFPKSVMRWANLVSAVMAEQKVPAKYLVGILAQIQQESWGDPTSTNLWDSNARRGTPSMGLLQMIAPTYVSYAKRGLVNPKYVLVPYANVWAALKYVKSRYGMSKFAKWNMGQNQGY